MNIAIVYFSGTGNTKRVGEVFKSKLEHMGHSPDMVDISLKNSKLKGYDLVIAGSPTYTMSSSHNLHAFIKKNISKSDNPNADFITYVTHGWGTSYGHLTLKDTAKKLGFSVLGAKAFLAPSNFYMFNESVQPKQSTIEIEQLQSSILNQVTQVLDSYLDKSIHIEKHSVIKKQQIALMSKLARKVFITQFSKKMLKVDPDKCTQCTVCVKKCPNQNIVLTHGQIHFGTDCSACGRCMHICPKNAYLYKDKPFEQFDLHQKLIV